MKALRKLASISADQPFLRVLAQKLLERHAHDAASLTRTLILLPNRRACRALRDAFLEASEGKPLLLPRIQPLGEVEEEGALFGDISEAFAELDALPPVIAQTRRHFMLTNMVLEFEKARAGRNQHIDQAANLARLLARFIDDVAREGLGFDNLANLVPEELQEHWQQTVEFLHIISHRWPQILEAEGASEPVSHRNALLAAVCRNWRRNPPAYPVIAAGSTGSQPATADLLAAIAELPQGLVILPGLDRQMTPQQWEMLGETHPQFGLKKLLERMEMKREEVAEFAPVAPSARLACLSAMLQPPAATSEWKSIALSLEEGLQGISLLSASTQLEEARLIAVCLREALETPAKTAALVTPDRTLARMVAAQMQRFGVAVDDSAGRRLAETPAASLMKLTVEMVAGAAAPSDLLALLRHPLAAMGLATHQCRFNSRLLEVALLRGVRPAPGLDGMLAALRMLEDRYPALEAMLAHMAEISRPLAAMLSGKQPLKLAELLRAHMALAEAFATTPEEAGPEHLWAGEAGNNLASLLAELLAQADILQDVPPHSYSALFDTLIAEAHYWPRFGLHPRLHILSPMEARLQRYDLVILGGLNEGTWPQLPAADPWMSRPMRGDFGLPASERAVGQSAHDIYQLCAAPEVVLTRSFKLDGAPTVPSRWVTRLETLVKGRAPDLLKAMHRDAYYAQALALLDAPAAIAPFARPAPVPPISARPRALFVTAIDRWLRDPYMLYARHILRLKPLSPLDQEPGAADFGNLVHEAMRLFTAAHPGALPPDPYGELLACGRSAFAPMLARPAVAALWWPRFEAMAHWLVLQERTRRVKLKHVAGEVGGNWALEVDGKLFTLSTIIDRLEFATDGTANIIDYKTGTPPTPGEVKAGVANQLPLEALIVLHGTLAQALDKPTQAGTLEYWKLAGNVEHCEITQIDGETLLAEARTRLEELIRFYDKPDSAYTAQGDARLLPRYNDYEHLTRRAEWEGV